MGEQGIEKYLCGGIIYCIRIYYYMCEYPSHENANENTGEQNKHSTIITCMCIVFVLSVPAIVFAEFLVWRYSYKRLCVSMCSQLLPKFVIYIRISV